MNIVYKLTNLSKEGNPKYYIGSKTECTIENINGISTIITTKTGRPYLGSSTNKIMHEDLKKNHIFSAEVLEEVYNKKNLLEIEDRYISNNNAVNSEEYYNLAGAKIGGFSYNQNAIINIYGESISEFGKSKSSLNRRHNSAKRFGFRSLFEFSIWIWEQKQLGKSCKNVADMIGWEKHAPYRYIQDYDMKKCLSEYDSSNEVLKVEIRKMISNGASVKKIASLLKLEIPTVCAYIDNFDRIYHKNYLTASRKGLTKEELEVKITKLILEGKGFGEVGKLLNIDMVSVKRYFLNCIRARLKSDDL